MSLYDSNYRKVELAGIEDLDIINRTKGTVHWGWYLLWLILFWPAVVIVAIYQMSKNAMVTVKICYNDGGIAIHDILEKDLYKLTA